MATLTFIGAARQVTGSCHLLETADGRRVLLDCGMRQGRRDDEAWNSSPFAFDPHGIDAVVISHAHIDHSGLLPRLVAEGYSGPIFATQASCELMGLMLRDSAHLQEKDAEWETRWRARLGRSQQIRPLYSLEDAERALKLCVPIAYEQPVQVTAGVQVSFHDAGHILGSAIVAVELREQGQVRRLVFSGDLGNSCTPLMRDPTPLQQADAVLMESTYGDRDHRCNDDTLEELAAILQQAHEDGGNVLIPAFSVGRTQDLLFHLGRFYQQGRLPQQVVFLDSPMAIQTNQIYSRYREQLDPVDRAELRSHGAAGALDWLPILRCTQDADESMAINRIQRGAIIIAGSGMCNGGRIVHHLKHNLWRRECHIIFPGYQAMGTLGRSLVDGASTVRILRQRIAVKAQIHTLGGFSAHAGQSQLIDWVSHFQPHPALYLVHGELDKMLILQQALREKLQWEASIPEPGQQISV